MYLSFELFCNYIVPKSFKSVHCEIKKKKKKEKKVKFAILDLISKISFAKFIVFGLNFSTSKSSHHETNAKQVLKLQISATEGNDLKFVHQCSQNSSFCLYFGKNLRNIEY